VIAADQSPDRWYNRDGREAPPLPLVIPAKSLPGACRRAGIHLRCMLRTVASRLVIPMKVESRIRSFPRKRESTTETMTRRDESPIPLPSRARLMNPGLVSLVRME
jgi:hypothetical protein